MVIRIKRQILVVDNDLAVCQAISNSMKDHVTNVCYMTSAVEALACYMQKDYCLVILDVQLAKMNGMELLRTIRNTRYVPILVLSESLSAEEKVALYHAGADAYIEKPLNTDVCIAQANALIQLYVESDTKQRSHGVIIFGTELVISPRYRQVMIDGKSLELTKKEFDLLHCFARSPGQVFSREQLYAHVWNDDSVMSVDETVKAHIKTLRKKLASVGKHYIHNKRGVGYKFIFTESE